MAENLYSLLASEDTMNARMWLMYAQTNIDIHSHK